MFRHLAEHLLFVHYCSCRMVSNFHKNLKHKHRRIWISNVHISHYNFLVLNFQYAKD
jgi:hypothetical protein